MTRPTCCRAPEGWLCLREPGHDGPCAAAPLIGSGACPDIDRCIHDGCQAKCGPDLKPSLIGRLKRLSRWLGGRKAEKEVNPQWLECLRQRWTQHLPCVADAFRESAEVWTAAGKPCGPVDAGRLARTLYDELHDLQAMGTGA